MGTLLIHAPKNLTDSPDFVRIATPLDLVQDVLAKIRLTDALFLRAEFTAPWAHESPAPDDLAQFLRERGQRLVVFHIISEGSAWVRLSSGEELTAGAGEVVVLPYAQRHIMGSARDARPVAVTSLLPPVPWEPASQIRYGGGGARTSIVCGYLTCGDPMFEPVVNALPPVFAVKPPAGPVATWVSASIQYALNALNASTSRHAPSGQALRLSELVFTEALRLYAEREPDLRAGWLAALRDPVVGPALQLLHAELTRKWTVEELARCVATSRSSLNERFVRLLGRAPMQYLGEWRLQVAADLLRATSLSAAMVACRVGYESEEAFNRAFKRALGSPPAQWRQRARSA